MKYRYMQLGGSNNDLLTDPFGIEKNKPISQMRKPLSIRYLNNEDQELNFIPTFNTKLVRPNQFNYNDYGQYQADLDEWGKQNNTTYDYAEQITSKDGIPVVTLTDDEVNNPIIQKKSPWLARPKSNFNWRIPTESLQFGLGEIAGQIDRRRQKDYLQNQISQINQIDALPVSNFQPNPFSLYAKYGGSINKYKSWNK